MAPEQGKVRSKLFYPHLHLSQSENGAPLEIFLLFHWIWTDENYSYKLIGPKLWNQDKNHARFESISNKIQW